MDAIRAANIVYDDTRAAQATYAAQLASLDAAQQKVALSQFALNQQQREAVLNFTKLTAAGQNYTVEQLAEELHIEANTLATKLNLKAKDQLTEATIANAIATGALRGELAESVLQYLASKVAEDAKTASTIAATGAQQGYNLALKETAALMLSTPMGWVSLLLMLIPLLITAGKKFKELYEAAHPTLEQLQTDLSGLQDELSELDGKLDDNNKRLAELRALREGGTISIVESEELKRLERENELLESQIQLQKDLIAAKQGEVYRKAEQDARQWISDAGWRDTSAGFSDPVQEYTGRGGLTAAIADYKAAKEAWEKAVDDGAAAETEKEQQKFAKEAEKQEKLMTTALSRMTELQDEAIKLRAALNPDDPESAGLIRELDMALDRIRAMQDPDAATKSIISRLFDDDAELTAEKVAEVNEYLRDLGLIVEDIPKDELSEMLGKTGDAADESADRVQNLTDVLKKFGVEEKELYAHGGNVDLLDRRVVEVTNSNLSKVMSHDANAQVGDRMTVLSKTIQEGESAIVVTPILPNGEILSDAELSKYVANVVKAAKKDKSTNYQAYDQKGLFLGVFGDKTTFEKNNEQAEEFATRLHEIHEAILEAGNAQELSELVAELQALTEYNPSIATMAEKFADAESKVNQLSKALKEFNEDGTISNDTLAEIGQTFGDLDTFENFAKVMMDSASSMEQAQQAANDLASEFMNSTTVLDMLREGNAELVKTMLEKIGVTNAEEVVEARLNVERWEAKLAAEGYADAEWSLTQQKLQEIGATNADITAIEGLRKKQVEAKIASMDMGTANGSTIASLIQMAEAAGIAGKRLEILTQIANLEASASPGMKLTYQYGAAMNRLKEQLLAGFSDDLKVELPEVKVSVPTVSGGSGKSGSSKEVEAYTAEIDRFREALHKLSEAEKEREQIEAQLSRTHSLDDEIALREKLTQALIREQDAMHALNEERDAAIHENVDKLKSLGFEVEYDDVGNKLWIKNLEHVNELTDKDRESTNALIKSIEKLAETTEKWNESNESTSGDWWEREADKIQNVIDKFEAVTKLYENKITLTENWLDNAVGDMDYSKVREYTDNIAEYYRKMQENIAAQAAYYRSKGYSDESDEVSKLSDLWWDYEKKRLAVTEEAWDKIVQAAHDGVDKIQDVYDKFHQAANEFAENGGFISIDTFQSILQLGAQYMQFLRDENGLLTITDEKIEKIIAAKTEELAIEQALAYIEKLRIALSEQDAATLEHLLYATSAAASSTWDLVYANLALLDLDESQYRAALHNINALRSLAYTAVQSIGKVAGESREELEKMKSGLDDIVKYVMEMLKQRIQQQIQDLQDMKTAYAEIISEQKEMLRQTKKMDDYNKSLNSKLKDAARLQAQIDALRLDTSREAQAKRIKLEEELAELQDDIADTQRDHAIEVTEEQLDKQQKAYEDEKDAEIKILEESISSYQKLYDMAISYIENNWNTLYDELIAWNTEYGSVLNSTITEAWDNALAAAQRYGSYVAALQSIDSDIAAASGGGHNDVVGQSTFNEDTGYTENRGNVTAASVAAVHNIVAQMKGLSAQWSKNNDKATNDALHAEAAKLAAQLDQYGVHAQYSNDGYWTITRDDLDPSNVGKMLYSVYHKGGIVGGGTIRDNEELALLKNNEWVLSEKMVDSLRGILERMSKLGGTAASLPGALRQELLSGDGSLSGVTNANRSVTVTFGDTIINGGNAETVRQHQEITREQANEVLKYLDIHKRNLF